MKVLTSFCGFGLRTGGLMISLIVMVCSIVIVLSCQQLESSNEMVARDIHFSNDMFFHCYLWLILGLTNLVASISLFAGIVLLRRKLLVPWMLNYIPTLILVCILMMPMFITPMSYFLALAVFVVIHTHILRVIASLYIEIHLNHEFNQALDAAVRSYILDNIFIISEEKQSETDEKQTLESPA